MEEKTLRFKEAGCFALQYYAPRVYFVILGHTVNTRVDQPSKAVVE